MENSEESWSKFVRIIVIIFNFNAADKAFLNYLTTLGCKLSGHLDFVAFILSKAFSILSSIHCKKYP